MRQKGRAAGGGDRAGVCEGGGDADDGGWFRGRLEAVEEVTETAGGFVVVGFRGGIGGRGLSGVETGRIGEERVMMRVERGGDGEEGKKAGAEGGEETPERGQWRGGRDLQSDCN